MTPQESNEQLKKLIDEQVQKGLVKFLQGNGFTARKLTDTPTDNNSVVPRKYVNMYASTAGLPVGSVYGQHILDTTRGYPVWKNTNGRWISATGSVVG